MRKVLFTVHPRFVQRGNWNHLHALRRNLELAKRESWAPEVTRKAWEYVTHPTPEEVASVLDPVDTRPFVFDIETVGWDEPKITVVGVCREEGRVVVVPWRAPYVQEFTRAWQAASVKVGHNSEAFDVPIVRRECGEPGGPTGDVGLDRFDTILAHGLCFPDMEHGLDDLALDYSEELPWKSRKRWSLELYCAKDVRVTWDSYRALQGELDELGLTKLMEKQLRRAQVLHEMCNHGVRVNHGRMHQVRVQLEQRQLHLTHQLSKASGMITGRVRRARCLERAADSLLATAAANWVPGKKREFGKLKTRAKHLRREAYDLVNVNWRSHDQKVDLLYRWLEAPQQWKTDHRGRRSLTCDKDAVVEIRRRASDDKLKVPYLGALRQITEVLNAWNEYATVVGTFTSYTDRVLKPDLRLFGTATGRLACRNPNLQNLPKRKDYSWMIRSMFEPVTPGNVFIGRDYSQIEARLQAHMSQEPSMVEAFERGEDIHSKTAALCLTQARGRTVLPGEVTPQERLVHKRAVYLESYGGGWLRLQRALAAEGVFISTLQAKDTLRSLRAARPVLAAYREELLDRAAQRRMLRTEFGRLRWFLGPAYGEVLNFPFQSNTAEIILDAMVRIRQRLPEGAKLVLQVHDELFVECPPGVVEEVDQMMKEVMESPIPELGGWTCPTDAKTGPNLAFKEY